MPYELVFKKVRITKIKIYIVRKLKNVSGLHINKYDTNKYNF